MSGICDNMTVNTHLAREWAQQYNQKGEVCPGFLDKSIEADELYGVLTAVHYGNEWDAFFESAGVETYGDLVNRLRTLAQKTVPQ
jgi:hypothetical protein